MVPQALNMKQPLVFAVGDLGEGYWTWVNKPEPGQPRFFGPNWMEYCSKTVWWIVPLIWVPVYMLMSIAAMSQQQMAVAELASLQLVGIVLWQLLEYTIHRFLFHAKLSSYWGITIHFLFHGCHHKFPMDAERLVFPPVPATPIVCLIYGMLRVLLPQDQALGLMSGILLGYVLYDCLHYAIHHGWRLPGPLVELRIRHNHHHYHDHHNGYGISSVAFDVLFGTRAQFKAC
jgi:dihydroceramide fatty acyl 2-hydroxylase